MKKDEIENIIKDYIDTRIITNQWELLFCIIILVFFAYGGYLIASTLKHNSDVDYRNRELKFCSDIYNSDKVILEQCKEYFIILDN